MRANFGLSVAFFVAALGPFAALAQNASAPRQEGQIEQIDEPSGTITVKQEGGATRSYRPKDGLLFSALQPGDRIRFVVEQAPEGATMVSVEKE